MSNKDIYILGIESSCDDTSVAVLKNDQVLSNKIANQSIHKKYGGVVPELASRAHLSNIIPVTELAINESGISLNKISAIAYTRGPGLMGSLIVGAEFAKSLGVSLNIPVIEVNHMQAHILANFINNSDRNPEFPFIGITISGGHTQFILVEDYFKMKILGETLDDAIGEAFDKCGKKMGLKYPSGPEIDRLAKKGNPDAFTFPVPKVDGLDLSYSGLKTAFINLVNKNINKNPNFIDENLNDLCASIQKTLVTVIMEKITKAKKKFNLNSVVIGGGVAANYEIRKILNQSKTVASPTRIRELLAPTVIYVKPLLKVFHDNLIKGAAHITGGGFFENIPRSLPDTNLASKINQTTWTVPEIFQWLQFEGGISDREMFSTFNCGVGMVLFSDPANTEKLINTLSSENCDGFKIGEVVSSDYAPKKSELLIR